MNRAEFNEAATAYLQKLDAIRNGVQVEELEPVAVPALAVCHLGDCSWGGRKVPHLAIPNVDGDFRLYCPNGHQQHDITLMHDDGAETVGGEWRPYGAPAGVAYTYSID